MSPRHLVQGVRTSIGYLDHGSVFTHLLDMSQIQDRCSVDPNSLFDHSDPPTGDRVYLDIC